MSQITIELIQKGIDKPQSDVALSLTLSNNMISEISEIIQIRCPKIQTLNLNHNQITRIKNITNSKLPNLQNLQLAFNQIESLTGIEGLTLLTTLNLAANQILQLQKITLLKQLQHLNLSYNQLQKLEGVEQLRELRVLNVSGNQLKRIDFLVFTTKLVELHASKNKIQAVSGKDFQNCPQITILDLSHNQISETGFVNSLLNLELASKLISQQHCGFRVYACKLKCTNTGLEFKQVLNIFIVRILVINHIEYKYRNLTHLYVKDNDILTEYDLKFVKEMENLIELDFRENPFWNQEFEDQLIFDCPWIQLINGKEVGKPAQYYIKEIEKIKDELLQENITIETYKYQDLDIEENDVITEERFKAILRMQKLDEEEEDETSKLSLLPNDKSQLLFQDQDQFQQFIDERNQDASKIRSRYMSIMHKNIPSNQSFTKEEEVNEDSRLEDSQSQTSAFKPLQSDLSSSDFKQAANTQETPSARMVIGAVNKKSAKRMIAPRQSLPSAGKTSILQQISHLKQTQNTPEFIQQMGMVDQNRKKISRQIEEVRMASSQENFNQSKRLRSASSQKMDSSEKSKTIGSVKLPKINK